MTALLMTCVGSFKDDRLTIKAEEYKINYVDIKGSVVAYYMEEDCSDDYSFCVCMCALQL